MQGRETERLAAYLELLFASKPMLSFIKYLYKMSVDMQRGIISLASSSLYLSLKVNHSLVVTLSESCVPVHHWIQILTSILKC
jgi:hypothetical protein